MVSLAYLVKRRFVAPENRVRFPKKPKIMKGEQADIGLLRLTANKFYDSSEGSIPLLSAKIHEKNLAPTVSRKRILK